MNFIGTLIRVAIGVAVLSLGIDSWAQGTDVGIRRPTLVACDSPQWSDEARRYDLEGVSVLKFDVDDNGRPTSIQVVRSSGWGILDSMSIRAMESCRFEAPTDPQVVRTGLRNSYVWKLQDNGEYPVSAALVPGSCPASKHIGAFLPFAGKVPAREDGILVRFLLDEAGNTFGIKVEETNPAPIGIATEFIKSCRFSAATLNGKPVRGNLTGWLTFK